MAKREYFKNEGEIDLPIDGTFYTDEFSPDMEAGIVIIALYDANGDIVSATAGTCTPEVSPISGQWFNGVSSGDEEIDLSEAGPAATYSPSTFLGPQMQARITLSSVSGALYARAYLWRK